MLEFRGENLHDAVAIPEPVFPATEANVIEVRNLVKRYDEKAVVAGVSFTLKPGEITGYLGPNGAGKSTTVKMITGVLPPTSGTVTVCGFDVSQQPLEAKRRIGYVPETQALYTSLTPNEYLSLVAELHNLEPDAAAERIRQLIEAFGLSESVNRLIESFFAKEAEAMTTTI